MIRSFWTLQTLAALVLSAIPFFAGVAVPQADAAVVTDTYRFSAPITQIYSTGSGQTIASGDAPSHIGTATGSFTLTFDTAAVGYDLPSIVTNSLNFDPGSQVVFSHEVDAGIQIVRIGGIAGEIAPIAGYDGVSHLTDQDFGLTLEFSDLAATAVIGSSFVYTLPGNGGTDLFSSDDVTVTAEDDTAGTQPVPEPTSLVLFGIGIAGLCALRRERRWTDKPGSPAHHRYSCPLPS